MTPKIRIKLRIFPTPRYLKNTKNVNPKDSNNPLLELTKIKEDVKNKDRYNNIKNTNIVQFFSGPKK